MKYEGLELWRLGLVLRRPVGTSAGTHATRPVVLVRVIADGTCVVVYADDKVAMSGRMYGSRAGSLGLFATEGDVTFENISVKTTT